MKRLLPLLLLLAQPAAALSVERVKYISGDNVIFVWDITSQGVVFVVPQDTPEDFFELLPDCTARNLALGTGTWGYANGGWLMQFADRSIGFPRQEPPPVNGAVCPL
jgi:hypothetical protein